MAGKKSYTKRSRKSRKSRKSKIRFPVKKVAVAASAVFLLCAVSLALSIFLAVPRSVVPPAAAAVSKEAVVSKESAVEVPEVKPVVTPEKKEPVVTKPVVKPLVRPVSKPVVPPVVKKAPEVKPVPAEPVFVIPPAEHNACLVFVFDDAGQNLNQLASCLALPFPVTIAVLPGLPHSVECAQRTRASGNQVLLHQPMQALNGTVNPGPGAINPSMGVQQIRDTIRKNIAEIGPVAGLNNHEGSRITENEVQIGAVLDEAAAEGIFFLDSRTTAQTRAPQAALERGMTIYERDVFLDNTEKKADILSELYRGLAIANKKGRVIMIGHVWSAATLPGILSEVYPQLIKKGYRFSVVKE